MFQGKAGSLKFLRSLKLNVPHFEIITHEDFVSWGSSSSYQVLQDILNQNDQSKIFSAAEAFVQTVKVPKLNFSTEKSYAVRSSASVEDSPDNSFAGIFETKLFVQELEVAIKEVWLSLFAKKALQYSHDRKISWTELKMDIVIQEMINGDKSGVLFQANPSGNITEQVIVAGYGLGQGIVDEESDTDRYTIENFEIKESFIAEKATCLIYQDNLIKKAEVPTQKRSISTLGQSEIEKLLTAGMTISTYTDHYMDIEFTFRNNELFLLQARPITTLPSKKLVHIFDNSNIAENYPGFSSPLTYSALSRGYATNFKNLIRYVGFKEEDWAHLNNKLDHLIGYWGGQIYYNLNNWYSVYTLLPFGAKRAVASFNEMVGINTHSLIEIPQKSFFSKVRGLSKILPRFLSFFLNGKSYHREYKTNFKKLYEEHLSAINEAKNSFEYIHLMQKLDNDYLSIIKIPLFNDFFSSLLNFACRKLARRIFPENGEQLYNDLLSNREELESSKAIYSLLDLSEMVQKNPNLEDQNFKTKLKTHFDRFGDRSQWEMKLEVPTARENPETTLKLILEYAKAGMSKETQRQREIEKSEAAKAKFSSMFFRMPFTSLLFKFLFIKCTEALSFREDSRFDRVRIKGLSRNVILKLGQEMTEKKILPTVDDIFYLTYEEVMSLVHDSFGLSYWKELIELRKKHLNEKHSLRLPDRILTNDFVSVKNFNLAPVHSNSKSIKGIPCSGGLIETECEVVLDLNSAPSLNGKILVAERTDPAWGYFFVGVKGIIIEKGSMLSHAAIISRELGIPCIINVKNATQILKSGMKIRMNGDTGEIEVVEEKSPTT